jgi:5-aminolevulinate synthase
MCTQCTTINRETCLDCDAAQPPCVALAMPGMHVTSASRYMRYFEHALETVHHERRYRVFTEIERIAGRFPRARWTHDGVCREIVVWCSNDYLGMGQNPDVLAAIHHTLDETGAGAGGTRNISGNTQAIIDLEAELADLHRKEAALVFTVRRQGFWDNRRRELTEALVHQVCHIRPLHLDEASGAV